MTHSGKGDELEKLGVALQAGADFVMDLSVGEDVKARNVGMRKEGGSDAGNS